VGKRERMGLMASTRKERTIKDSIRKKKKKTPVIIRCRNPVLQLGKLNGCSSGTLRKKFAISI